MSTLSGTLLSLAAAVLFNMTSAAPATANSSPVVLLSASICDATVRDPTTSMRIKTISQSHASDAELMQAARSAPVRLNAEELHDAAIALLTHVHSSGEDRRLSCQLLQKSAQKGVDYAYFSLGELLYATAATKEQQSTAAYALRRAAVAGVTLADLRIAEMTAAGQGFYEKNPEKAFQSVDAIARAGEPFGDLVLGSYYFYGIGVEANGSAARSHFEAAAKRGVMEGEVALGWLYRQGAVGVPPDVPTAIQWYERAYQHGRTDVAIDIGQLYQSARNPNADPTKAIFWFERTQAVDQPFGQAEIARTLAFQMPPEKRDVAKACSLASKAAIACNRTGAFVMYLLLEYGRKCPSRLSGIEWLKRSVALGSSEGKMELGSLTLVGKEVPRDVEKAKALFDDALKGGMMAALCGRGVAELDGTDAGIERSKKWLFAGVYRGWPECMSTLGGLIVTDKIPEIQDKTVGVRMLRDSAEKGVAESQRKIGDLYLQGQIIARDEVQALHFFSMAADAGDARALTMMGYFYSRGWGGIISDRAKAAQYFERAAAAGSQNASLELSGQLLRGDGIAKDAKRALALREAAAKAGYTPAMNLLCADYRDGREGLPVDLATSLEYARRSANLGDSWGLTEMGDIYRLGRGVAANETLAFQYYQKGADKGDMRALNAIGMAYLNGMGNYPKDTAKASSFFAKVAEQGNANAMISLASLYGDTTLGAPDKIKQLAYLRLAIERPGNDLDRQQRDRTRSLRDFLQTGMSANDLEKVDAMMISLSASFHQPPEAR